MGAVVAGPGWGCLPAAPGAPGVERLRLPGPGLLEPAPALSELGLRFGLLAPGLGLELRALRLPGEVAAD